MVFILKCRRKTLYVRLRKYLEEVFRQLAEQKESRIEDEHLMPARPYAIENSTEARSVASGWIYQRKVCDPFGAGI